MIRLLRTSSGQILTKLLTWLLILAFADMSPSRVSGMELMAQAILKGVTWLTAPEPVPPVVKNQILGSVLQLDGLDPLDPDAASRFYQWFGPYPTVRGPQPLVQIPEGAYTLTLQVDQQYSTHLLRVLPAFTPQARVKSGKVQLVWNPVAGAEKYEIYRAGTAKPIAFAKIGEVISSYATVLDETVVNGNTYLYVIGVVGPDLHEFSAVVSAHPTASRGTMNYSPVIYSSPVLHGTSGILYHYHVLATDPNVDALSYHLLEGPTGMTIDSATGLIAWEAQPGSHAVRVQARDLLGASDTQSYGLVVGAANTPPAANAGPDQMTIRVAETVSLDGSQSRDPDGDPLHYQWSFTSRPPGSSAALSDRTVPQPVFVVDLPGLYELQLVVNDGQANSPPDTVIIRTINSAPIADAGTDQAAHVTQTVILDGSGSSDLDGDPLSFAWSFLDQPPGSTATLSNPSSIQPSFLVDRPGAYLVQLIVNDGQVNSAPATVTVTTANSAPVAEAGPSQTTFVTRTVTLNGSGSTDADGDPLTFLWSFISRPAGSAAVLSDATAAQPTFVADKFGVYEVQLMVNDGQANSAPDTITITTENTAPVAHAGADQTAVVTQTLTLDGSASTDADGQALTYRWTWVHVPLGSAATFSDATIIKPTFTVDRPGNYQAQLMVNDGLVDSAPDTITVSTVNSAPAANAGPDQTAQVTQIVTLDGSGSTDVDNDALTYLWSFASMPEGSGAVLLDSTAVHPTFVVDLPGAYTLQLIVNDGQVDSPPDTMTVSTSNSAPVAQAGSDQEATTGATVSLDGSASSDVDNDPLSYRWSFTSVPTGSGAVFSDPTGSKPTFVPDLAGIYVAQLIVNDGHVDSAPDTATITVTVAQVQVPNVVGLTQAAAETALATAKLTVGNITTDHSPTVPAGSVVSQAPVAGATVPAGSPVDLVISQGPAPVQVPNVVGLLEAAAAGVITSAQLTVGSVTQANSPTVPDGHVISQTPAAGASVPPGTAVSLVISLGSGAPVLTSISVTPGAKILSSGETQQYTATGRMSDGSSPDLTTSAFWTSSLVNVANITSAGLASALDAGSTTISASKDGITASVTLTVQSPQLASIVITPASASILAGQSQGFSATGIFTDGTSQSLITGVIWESSPASVATVTSGGVATGVAQGSATISAQFQGITATANLTVSAVISDPTAPTAAITAPANNSILTQPADVIGTANDANFLKYVLDYAVAGQAEFTTLVESANPVANGVLGKFDPTLLLNDIYTVRLRVFDKAGSVTQASVQYQVARDQKVGIFTLAFQDLSIPLSGLPITINRVYDSRDKSKGDFGVGWRLDIQTMKVRANRVQGTGWNVTMGGSFLFWTYYLNAADQHKISITLPDGKVEEFDFTPSPTSSVLFPFQWLNPPAYTARAGTLGSLVPIGTVDLYVEGSQPGTVELVDFWDFSVYDPHTFQYTSADGRVFVIDKTGGVQSIREPNGNTLTFNANGIIHSSGKSVAFTRDGQGRITQIKDPNGNIQRYGYNLNGDLGSHTDVLNNTTRYYYNLSHGLLEIRDTRGVRPVRNEYDENGRLVAHIDAEGNRVEYIHNVGARQEIIQDRLGRTTVFNYDEQGNVIFQSDAMGHTKSFTYDARGNKLTETDPLGYTKTLTYDSRNNILTRTDRLGNVTVYTYNAQNQVLTTTDPLGHITSNTYDARGNLLTTTDPSGAVTTYTYDARGNRLTSKDALGRITTFEYDGTGNLTREVNSLGHATTYTYDSNGNRLTESKTRTAEGGNSIPVTTTMVYDAQNRLIKTTDTYGHFSIVEYNAAGKQSATIDKLGHRTSYEYDARGNLTVTVFPDGTKESLLYDAENNKIAAVDRAGRTTKYEYDVLNRLMKTIFPDGTFTQTIYDAAGRQIVLIDERGSHTTREFDAAGRNTQVVDALGYTSTIIYNAAGQQMQFTDANGNSTSYQYDLNGRRTSVIWPNGNHIDTEYNALGQRTAVTDESNKRTQYEYDVLGHLIRITNPLGGVTEYSYDELENRISQKDANGHITRFAYDSLGRMVKRTLPLGMAEHLSYDPCGNLITKTDFNGATISYTYDGNQRLTRRFYPDGSQVTFTYTPTGQRHTVSSSRGVTTYQYDSRDRLIGVLDPRGANISYTYDALGNRTKLTVPSGATIFSYDALNRLQTVTDPTGGVIHYAYDSVGNRVSVTYPNGTATIYAYDNLNRLIYLENSNSSGGINSSYYYTLGSRGNRIRVVEHSGRTVNYTYDDMCRLIAEDITDPTLGNNLTTYTYDPVGNRHTKADSTRINNYSYDANDRLLSEGGNSYTYNASGSTLTRTDSDRNEVTYSYNVENRLISANIPGKVLAYEYDEDGLRTSSSNNGAVTQYLVDKNRNYAQVLEERAQDNSLIVSYIYGDDLISQQRSGSTSYYHYDGHGSTRTLTDSSGIITDTYIFDAFGLILGEAGTTENLYLYAGEPLDANAGFYYLRDRYYNYESGRFLTMDAYAGDPQTPNSLHKYLYASNDPVNNCDPSGQYAATISLLPLLIMAMMLYILLYMLAQSLKNIRVPDCPPCPAPPDGGTRTDIVPPSSQHWPCPGSHTHRWWYEVNQVPWPSCRCFNNRREDVICH